MIGRLPRLPGSKLPGCTSAPGITIGHDAFPNGHPCATEPAQACFARAGRLFSGYPDWVGGDDHADRAGPSCNGGCSYAGAAPRIPSFPIRCADPERRNSLTRRTRRKLMRRGGASVLPPRLSVFLRGLRVKPFPSLYSNSGKRDQDPKAPRGAEDEVDHPVAAGDDAHVVLHHHDRVARIHCALGFLLLASRGERGGRGERIGRFLRVLPFLRVPPREMPFRGLACTLNRQNRYDVRGRWMDGWTTTRRPRPPAPRGARG
jgi:hypothetical protein